MSFVWHISTCWRQIIFFSEEEEYEKVYYGLPITSIAIILPILFVIHMIVGAQIFSLVLTIMLFIANFKLRKPSNKVLLLICLLVAAALIFSFVQGGGMQWHAVLFTT